MTEVIQSALHFVYFRATIVVFGLCIANKIRVNYESGWVGARLTRKIIIGKSAQISGILILIFCGSILLCICY